MYVSLSSLFGGVSSPPPCLYALFCSLAHKGTCQACYLLRSHTNTEYFVVLALKKKAEFSLGMESDFQRNSSTGLWEPQNMRSRRVKLPHNFLSVLPAAVSNPVLSVHLRRCPVRPRTCGKTLLAVASECSGNASHSCTPRHWARDHQDSRRMAPGSICVHSLSAVYTPYRKGPPDELRDCLCLPRTTIRRHLVTRDRASTWVRSLMEGRQASEKSHFVQNRNVISLSKFIGHLWAGVPVTSSPRAGALGESSFAGPHFILLQRTRPWGRQGFRARFGAHRRLLVQEISQLLFRAF